MNLIGINTLLRIVSICYHSKHASSLDTILTYRYHDCVQYVKNEYFWKFDLFKNVFVFLVNISGQNSNNGIFYAFISRCFSWKLLARPCLFMLQNAKNVQVAKTNNNLSDLTVFIISRLYVCNQATA